MSDLRLLKISQILLISALVAGVLIVTPYSSIDPINLPKMSLIGTFSFLFLGISLIRRSAINSLNIKLFFFTLVAFVVNSTIVLFFSGRNLVESFYGIGGRNTGYLTYFSLALLMYFASSVVTENFLKQFQISFLTLGIFLLIYGFVQYFGYEPFPYISAYANNVIGTFGNPNFHGAFLGIFGSFVLPLLFDKQLSLMKRVALFSVIVLVILGIVTTKAWQGFFSLAIGSGVALLIILFRFGYRRISAVIAGFGLLIAIFVAAALFNFGPLAEILAKNSLVARRIYWEAAVRILMEHPLFGVGWDGFGDWFRRGRSEIAASQNGGFISDSAHSVPLDIGSGGGFPLLVIYLAIVILIGLRITQAVLKRSNLSFTFVGISAAWVAYQAQSFISINQIGLATIGWTFSGLIIGYSTLRDPEDSKKSESKVREVKKFSFSVFVVPFIFLIIGLMVSLPPINAANKFHNALRSSDARQIKEGAFLAPLDIRRMILASNILERNNYHEEAKKIMVETTKSFPDSFEAWSFFRTLSKTSPEEKVIIDSELLRLDPNRLIKTE